MQALGLYFNKVSIFLLILLCHLFTLGAKENPPASYYLSDTHPLKQTLDVLFSTSRVLLNEKSMKNAGFIISKPRPFTNLIIASHPALPGYIFKLYLDAQRLHKHKPELDFWMMRIQGALAVRYTIETFQLQNLVKVPQKWLYQLPKKPKGKKGYTKRQYILVEEDMDLVSSEDNERLWKSDYITPDLLDAIYIILSNVGLRDCTKPDNLPFSRDGRVSFIDTQSHGEKVQFKRLESWLSPLNKQYWSKLTEDL